MIVKIVIPLLILIIGITSAYVLNKQKTEKRKSIVWGLTLMLIIAPAFSWLISGLYAFGTVENTGWAVVIYPMFLFPILFLLGIISLVKGILMKEINH
ncbi:MULTISPECIES: hypothetical protein [Bhargavaea]|uniref:Uncharacterized protein n=1 Tax=Bhargavaea changchunensis TaxID=2134037 RepID=A0ABW2NK86_9BACL|nr:hypothetical protein [Bhargavaea sp. CC-171006]